MDLNAKRVLDLNQGHSIGGCLAALLMFMYKRRGVLPNKNIATVYTFGAPSVFCENPGDEATTGSDLEDEQRDDGNRILPSTSISETLTSQPRGMAAVFPGSSMDSRDGGGARARGGRQQRKHRGGPSRLMASLGIRDLAVRNVIMHRDIVPRAFSCDYSPVADILRGWGAGFRDHTGLGYDGRKHLYYFVGRMIVLQPDRSFNSFVNNDPDHPMLPPGPQLLYLADPSEMHLPVREQQQRGARSEGVDGGQLAPPTGPSARTAIERVAKAPVPSLASGRVPSSAHEAVMELMDSPHPLEILADPNAYLSSGTISR